LMFFAVGIPFFFLTVLGFKLLSPKMKSIGTIAKYTLLAIWIVSVGLALVIGIKQAKAFAVEGRVVQKETINLKPTDTITIKCKYNEYFAKNLNDHHNFKITLDSVGNNKLYSNNIHFKIAETDEPFAYVQVEKEARGATLVEAKKRAEKIEYHYQFSNNQLVLDNYLVSDLNEKFRDQQIEVSLFLPKGTLLKMDKSMADYDITDGGYFTWNADESNAVYKMDEIEIKCINCFEDEIQHDLEEDDVANDSVTTTVNVDLGGVSIKKTTTSKGLSLDKDGVIIKNK
jgi:hypothetical protein